MLRCLLEEGQQITRERIPLVEKKVNGRGKVSFKVSQIAEGYMVYENKDVRLTDYGYVGLHMGGELGIHHRRIMALVEVHAAYWRRVVRENSKFPLILFQLLSEDEEVVKQAAKAILRKESEKSEKSANQRVRESEGQRSSESEVQGSARFSLKPIRADTFSGLVREDFEGEIKYAAERGSLPENGHLRRFLRLIIQDVPITGQQAETNNKRYVYFGDRSPNIGVPLASDKVLVSKIKKKHRMSRQEYRTYKVRAKLRKKLDKNGRYKGVKNGFGARFLLFKTMAALHAMAHMQYILRKKGEERLRQLPGYSEHGVLGAPGFFEALRECGHLRELPEPHRPERGVACPPLLAIGVERPPGLPPLESRLLEKLSNRTIIVARNLLVGKLLQVNGIDPPIGGLLTADDEKMLNVQEPAPPPVPVDAGVRNVEEDGEDVDVGLTDVEEDGEASAQEEDGEDGEAPGVDANKQRMRTKRKPAQGSEKTRYKVYFDRSTVKKKLHDYLRHNLYPWLFLILRPPREGGGGKAHNS